MNNTLLSNSATKTSVSVFSKNFSSTIFIDLSVILLCVLLAFGRTISSYFLADDFGEIHYLYKICTTDPGLIIANFTGNYMQIPGMSVYRPFLLLSLLIDFIVWKSNAAGFYASNLLFYFLDAALLYLVVLRLACTKSTVRNRLTALTAATLFALSPLHCESVSWVLGRVDIVSAFFYLLSFLLILESRTAKSAVIKALAIAAFISGLFVKEMAIGIPVIAFLIGWLYMPASSDGSQSKSIKQAIFFSAPYLIATLAYFALRFVCLGTLVGGYVAGFGASQEKNALLRWLDPDTVGRIAYPLVKDQFQAADTICLSLSVLYALLAGVFIIRLLSRQVPLALFVFLAGWAVTTLLPIYKLWGIGLNLEGARFIFFFSMPLATMLAACLFQSEPGESDRLDRSVMALSSAVALSFALIFGYLAVKTNLIWVNAGKEVRAAAQSAISILSENKPNPAIFLGIPKEWKGTHMILNGDTFRAAIAPPFATGAPARKYAIFEPVMYSPEYEIDSERLKSLIDEKADTYVWYREGMKFQKVEYSGNQAKPVSIALKGDSQGLSTGGPHGLATRTEQGAKFEIDSANEGIELSNLHLNPCKIDFALLNLVDKKTPADGFAAASWTDRVDSNEYLKEPPLRAAPLASMTYIPLSRHWKWYEKRVIEKLFISFPPGKTTVESIELLPCQKCAPTIRGASDKVNENGIFALAKGNPLRVEVHAEELPAAKSLLLEISKANYFFDNFRESGGKQAVEKSIKIGSLSASHIFKREEFASRGFFQIRAVAVNENGETAGAPSGCITVSAQ